MNLRSVLLAAALVWAASSVALACIWDRDTLEMETKAFPKVPDVITGRFPRNPPLYYVRRLELATKRVEENADDLASYDDAGVACDRLGRSDEGIEWMRRKRERMDAIVGRPEGAIEELVQAHTYRHLANLGTFHAHRWIRNGADRSDLEDLETARDLIQRAIVVNPDAHFGRERYQLRAIEWLLTVEPWKAQEGRITPLGDILGLQGTDAEYQTDGAYRDRTLVQKGLGDAVKGLSGLIVLGNAWESVDVFHALSLALQAEGSSSAAYLARLRVEELVAAGRGSLRPGAPKGEELLKTMFVPTLLEKRPMRTLRTEYRERRDEARLWMMDRQGEILRRLRAGRHPDTDPEFWVGIEE
jgi:hypothetical protein